MNIYIIGYKGRLGSQLISLGCKPLDIDLIFEDLRDDVDHLDPNTDVIINCAAKTKVDACEEAGNKYYWEAVDVNGYGIDHLAKAYQGKIIHISTDYVFGGKSGPYSEKDLVTKKDDDLPTRKMSYGVTKMMGEMLAYEHENVHIVRTTGLYGGVSKKNDFLNMILDNYEQNDLPILVTKELKSNQTYIPHLALQLIACVMLINDPESAVKIGFSKGATLPKILHLASKEVISRYEFALMIADIYGLDKNRLSPVRNDQVPGWIAERPKKGGLKTNLAKKLGLPIYTILEGLEASKLANLC